MHQYNAYIITIHKSHQSLTPCTVDQPDRWDLVVDLERFCHSQGRIAIALVRKYLLPLARQVGDNLRETAIPEIGDVLAGSKTPIGNCLASVAKEAAAKTISKIILAGVALVGSGDADRKTGRRDGPRMTAACEY